MGRREATAFGWERTPWGRPGLKKILSSDCFVVLGAESFTKSGGGEPETTHTMTIQHYCRLRAVNLWLRSDLKVRRTGLLWGLQCVKVGNTIRQNTITINHQVISKQSVCIRELLRSKAPQTGDQWRRKLTTGHAMDKAHGCGKYLPHTL